MGPPGSSTHQAPLCRLHPSIRRALVHRSETLQDECQSKFSRRNSSRTELGKIDNVQRDRKVTRNFCRDLLRNVGLQSANGCYLTREEQEHKIGGVQGPYRCHDRPLCVDLGRRLRVGECKHVQRWSTLPSRSVEPDETRSVGEHVPYGLIHGIANILEAGDF